MAPSISIGIPNGIGVQAGIIVIAITRHCRIRHRSTLRGIALKQGVGIGTKTIFVGIGIVDQGILSEINTS